ncbi:serine hydrolase domain-containing protein [Vibrio penaeicida]|uniref:serine hydrolase domain-containing protein n=1 Tax=Vibrio penaeicida TaxID=104609 RepID=UPI000CE9AF39|nr:serine hydrolase [Vibrio penaeicida]
MRFSLPLTRLSYTIAATLAITIPFTSVAQDAITQDTVSSNKHLGLFSSNFGGLPHVKFYQHGDQDYILTAWGHEAITVDAEGHFHSLESGTGTQGKFGSDINGNYVNAIITYWGTDHTFARAEDANGDDLVHKIYQSSWFNSMETQSKCNEDWLVRNEDAKYDKDKLNQLLNKFKNNENLYQKASSFLVMKDGRLIVEEYMNGWKQSYPHSIQSVTKSLTSLMTGVAIYENKLSGIRQPLGELLPNHSQYLQGEKSKITLEHLLMMGAGLDWDEWTVPYSNPENIRYQEMQSHTPIKFTLDRPLKSEPGTQFNYNGGIVTVAGEIIANSYKTERFAGAVTDSGLSKLCFKNAYISAQMGDVSNTAGGGMLRPRDMLKLGMLVNNDGKWQGEPILTKEWIEDSTRSYLYTSPGASTYGYYWWLDDHFVDGRVYKTIYGLGYGGQMIAIVKDLDLVVVKTATNYANRNDAMYLMKNDIIPIFN